MGVSSQQMAMQLRYAAWANDLLYAALAEIPETELTASRRIFAGSILRTLNHVYLMDMVWKSHLLGVPHNLTTRNPESTPPFRELRAAQREMDKWYVQYADSLTCDQADEIVDFSFIGGDAGALRRGDILLHVAHHTTYHRGHVAAVLNQIGLDPPTTDLPVFLRERAAQSVNKAGCTAKLPRSTNPASPTPTRR